MMTKSGIMDFNINLCVAHHLTALHSHRAKNVITTAFGLGHLFVFVFYAVVPDVTLKMNIGAIFSRRVAQILPPALPKHCLAATRAFEFRA
jgi:hypothetical protein